MANKKSPPERPALPQVKSPSTSMGRLKSFSPDPLDPPDEDEAVDPEEYAEEYDLEDDHDGNPED